MQTTLDITKTWDVQVNLPVYVHYACTEMLLKKKKNACTTTFVNDIFIAHIIPGAESHKVFVNMSPDLTI